RLKNPFLNFMSSSSLTGMRTSFTPPGIRPSSFDSNSSTMPAGENFATPLYDVSPCADSVLKGTLMKPRFCIRSGHRLLASFVAKIHCIHIRVADVRLAKEFKPNEAGGPGRQ